MNEITENNSGELIPLSQELEKSIQGLNAPLANYLTDIGLPTQNVLYPISERKNVINSLKEVLSILPIAEKEKAYYLTKFIVAISVGLFDGALNYLWDETIKALRKLAIKFDLEYFYAVAEKVSARNKNLVIPDEIDKIGDHDLLETARRIGLLSEVNYNRLEHINYMRNHASAAHPNDHQIDGFEILGWLRVCLRHAILAEPDHSIINIKKLLDNIRTIEIPPVDLPHISSDIVKQPLERIDDFLWTIFGMFTDPRQVTITKNNIQLLAKIVWDASSEDRKYEIGSKFGVYRKNLDVARKEAAQDFLSIVEGNKYKDEDSLSGELLENLEILKSVHFGWNNFYNEWPHAKALYNSLPPTGKIPRASRKTFVKVIAMCFIGNGLGYREGVDESAVKYYEYYINNFSDNEIIDFLTLMNDPEFITSLPRPKVDKRIRILSNLLKTRSNNIYIKKALDLIITGPSLKLDQVRTITEFQKNLSFLIGVNN